VIDTLRTSHPAYRADGGPTEPTWLGDTRRTALARFEALGLPGSHLEAWRYTSTRVLAEPAYRHARAGSVADVAALVDAHRLPHAAAELVLIDGWLAPELSRLPATAGVEIVGLADALTGADPEGLHQRLGRLAAWQDEAFTALNTAFLQDGLWLRVGRNVDVVGPVHVIVVGSPVDGPVVAHVRHLIEVAAGARVAVVETLVGREGEPVLTNVVTELHVGPNAEARHVVAGLHPETAHAVHTLEARLDRDARLHATLVWLGGAVTRSNVHVVHAAGGSEATLDGLYVLGGRQHVDNHTVVDHAAPACTTRETYKGALGGRSKGIFDGLVVVRQGASKTDSVQSCRNLLLSDEADASAKPTLEIYDEDVKCGHGTTVGQLDAEQLAYLRSRGIPLDEARRMLTGAFVADVVDRIADPAVRERLHGLVDARLARLQEVG
jgi:Fe-S cluster assembly protein SufD